MGAVDLERQVDNVRRMRLLGAEIVSVNSGTKTLKEAVDEALAAYMDDVENTYYLTGSAVGPAPYPEIVQFFQSVIGMETREQILKKEGRLPDKVIACLGGGSNAIGMIHPFIDDGSVELILAEAAGRGLDTNETAATLSRGSEAILHGFKSYSLPDSNGEVAEAYSISAGLDYPVVGPEIAHLHSIGRTKAIAITDHEAVEAFRELSRLEGIIPAIESAHALATLPHLNLSSGELVVVNISGRGDKDCDRLSLS